MNIAVLAHIRHAIAEPFMGGMEAHPRFVCDGPARCTAFDNGAMREIVGDCGFVVLAGDTAELGNAMASIETISRGVWRARAIELFCVSAMVRG